MSEIRYTPGPWKAVKAHHGPIDILDPRGRDVVTVYGGGVETESQGANARLIAAAPDLLDALGAVRDRFFPADQREQDKDIMWYSVNAAIAKAEGGAA